MGGPELGRSRRLIVAGLALTVAAELVLLWPRHGTARWLGYSGLAWPGLPLLVVPLLQHRARTVAARRVLGLRFIETSRGLATATTRSTAVAAVAIAASFFLYVLPVAWWQGYDVDPTHATTDLIFNVVTTVFLVVALFVLGAAVAVAWRGIATELTPVGVRTVGPLFVRLIPWQALVPGAPLRPAMTDDWLVLDVARPELIEQRGFSLGASGWGPRHSPRVSLAVNVHPWLIADAIRWYVEHPAERDLLGTPGAQDRLLAALHVPSTPPVVPA